MNGKSKIVVEPESQSEDLSTLFTDSRERLRRMVQIRMDRRLQGRIDASDVIQEAYVEAAQRYDEYKEAQQVTPFVWLRFLTCQKLMQLHRTHLGVKARDVSREVSLFSGAMPEATSAALAAQLIGSRTSPSGAVARAEEKLKVQSTLNEMDDTDREVLALRHFEQLTNSEAAAVLGISESTCYKRYVRALRRLKGELGSILE